MPRILALDLEETAVKAALVESSFRSARIESLLSERVARGGTPFDALARLIEEQVNRFDSAVCSAAAGAFSHRLLELPFSDRRKLEQIVPFEVEGHLPFDLDGHTVSFTAVGRREGGAYLVLATISATEPLRAYLESLERAGVDPVAVDLAPAAAANLLLHVASPGPGEEALVDVSGYRLLVALARDGLFAGMRAWRLAGQGPAEIASLVRWSLLALGSGGPGQITRIWVGGCGGEDTLPQAIARSMGAPAASLNGAPVSLVPPELRHRQADFVVPIGLALRHEPRHGATVALDLRRGELAYHGKREELWRRLGRLAAIGALALGLLVAGWAMRASRERARIAALNAQIRSIFHATLPAVSRVVNEKAQLEAAYAELQDKRRIFGGVLPSATKTVDLLRAITEAVPPAVGLEVEELMLESGTIKLGGTVPSFEAVDSLKKSLSSIPQLANTTIADVKASVDGQSVGFRATMTVRPD